MEVCQGRGEGGRLAEYLQLFQLFLHFLGHSSHCLCSCDPHVQQTERKGCWEITDINLNIMHPLEENMHARECDYCDYYSLVLSVF